MLRHLNHKVCIHSTGQKQLHSVSGSSSGVLKQHFKQPNTYRTTLYLYCLLFQLSRSKGCTTMNNRCLHKYTGTPLKLTYLCHSEDEKNMKNKSSSQESQGFKLRASRLQALADSKLPPHFTQISPSQLPVHKICKTIKKFNITLLKCNAAII